jgi:outer membrane protein, heavy metal efflux system
MNWGMTIRLLACCLLSAALALPAQAEPEPLKILINKALERNPELQSLRLQAQSAMLSARAAGALPDPQLSLGVMNLPHSSLSLDESPMSSIKLGVSQVIPWPGKLSGRSQVADLQARMTQQSVEQAANRIRREVTSRYYDYAFWTEGTKVLEDNLVLTEALIEVTRTRYANGEAAMQEVLRSQNARDRLLNRMRMFEQSAMTALLELQRLTNDTATAIAADNIGLPAVEADTTLTNVTAVQHNPALLQADLGLQKAQASHRLAKSEYWPNLMLGIDYSFRRDIPMDPVGGEDFLSFHVGVSLPLWFFNSQRHRSAAAEVAVASSRSYQRAVQIRLDQHLRDVRQTQESLAENITRYNTAILPQSNAAFESAQAAWQVGQIDFDALLATQLEWLHAQLERLELLRNYYHKLAELNEVLGHDHTGNSL